RLELLHGIVPPTSIIAVLINPNNPNVEALSKEVEEAAHALGRRLVVAKARSENEIEAAFLRLTEQRAGALFVATDALFFSQRDQLAALTKQYAIPAIFDRREFAEVGGLISYGGSVTNAYRLAGIYTGRILKGEKPADLPVQQSTRVELII